MDIKALHDNLENLEAIKKEAELAAIAAEKEAREVRTNFAAEHGKYKVGQRVKMVDSKNVGRMVAPEWVHTDIMVEVVKAGVQLRGENNDRVVFFYNLRRVRKDGQISKHLFGRGIYEDEIDLHN